jgi:hypothetical protein
MSLTPSTVDFGLSIEMKTKEYLKHAYANRVF